MPRLGKVGYAEPIPTLDSLGNSQLELVRDRIRYAHTKRAQKPDRPKLDVRAETGTGPHTPCGNPVTGGSAQRHRQRGLRRDPSRDRSHVENRPPACHPHQHMISYEYDQITFLKSILARIGKSTHQITRDTWPVGRSGLWQ